MRAGVYPLDCGVRQPATNDRELLEYRNNCGRDRQAEPDLPDYLPSSYRLPDEFDAVRRPTPLLQTDADVGW